MKEVKTYQKIDLAYLFLHKKLIERFPNKFLKKQDAYDFLSRAHRIPKKYSELLLKEFEVLGIGRAIKPNGTFKNYELFDAPFDIENYGDLQKKIGVQSD